MTPSMVLQGAPTPTSKSSALAKSTLRRPPATRIRRLQPFRYLHSCSGCFRLALTGALASPDSATPHRLATTPLRSIALALLALAFVQAALGALIGTQFALTVCTELTHCPGFAIDEFAQGAALDPFRRLVIVDGHAVAPAGAAGIHVMHRLLGAGLATTALVLAYALRSTNRRAAQLMMALALATPLLGATAVVAMPSLAVTVLQNAAAAALIATLAYIVAMRRAS